MMTKSFRSFALGVAFLALPAQAVAQAAKTPCLTEGEVRALTTFAMPSLLGGLIDRCGPQVGASGFMPTQGRGLVATYAARKDAAWPTARKAFFRIAGGKADDKQVTQAMQAMPDAALQPFVEGMISAMVGGQLKPGQCVIADKLMRLLAPLPPENTTELLGTIFELADSGKKPSPGGFSICKP